MQFYKQKKISLVCQVDLNWHLKVKLWLSFLLFDCFFLCVPDTQNVITELQISIIFLNNDRLKFKIMID